ncbi:MAG: hypothetical protein K9W46_09860 [Candidatus Heimdallarchaeum endolithica]|uniref:FIST domain-containing protein n=1 Tax=Candidatus Heimdallarchaeum endolithica TaxID=2876572 RepID=A0A9Y1FMR3_9ARCH|nr:MAG: hypothetical protein K9W46_09860 [Candidatus Heimdallarchaeum endolithica]
MQVKSGMVSNRSLKKVVKELIDDVILEIKGIPDFLLIAFTSKYKRTDYKRALELLTQETGVKNLIGGTFPAIGVQNEVPTTQGGAAFTFKGSEIKVQRPIIYKNIRTKKKKFITEFPKIYNTTKAKSKIAFVLSTGPKLQPNAMEQLKLLDSYPAIRYQKMFNVLGSGLEWLLGKQGLGTGSYIDELLNYLAINNVSELIGGATFDIDLENNYQFVSDFIYSNSLVGTSFSSDTIKFGHSWTFDKSEKTKEYSITHKLKSGYIQKINGERANNKLLQIMDVPSDIYNEFFEKFSYANALYLSGIKEEDGNYHPFMTANHPKLKGVVSTLPPSKITEDPIKAELFTQSGLGIEKSAYECVNKAAEKITNPKFGIFINCANRLLIAGDKIAEENKKLAERLGDNVPFITLYSGCEFSIFSKKPKYTTVSIHGLVAGK